MDLYTKEASSVIFDNLLAGMNVDIVKKSVTLKTGQGVLKRGTVLGIIAKAIGAPAADVGNTGNGTVTDVSMGSTAKGGTYTLTCITAAANGGTFKVIDPDGVRLADAVVGAAYVGPINFTINDGAADFVVNDKFTIAVTAPAAVKSVTVNSANVDGSQTANCILADDTDTGTEADVVAVAYASGYFNRQALIFGGTDTAAKHEAKLRELGIFLRDNIAY